MGIFNLIKEKKEQFKDKIADVQRGRLEQQNLSLMAEKKRKSEIDAVFRKNVELRNEVKVYDDYRKKNAEPSKLKMMAANLNKMGQSMKKRNAKTVKTSSPFTTMGNKPNFGFNQSKGRKGIF
jgi:hypothetical protein